MTIKIYLHPINETITINAPITFAAIINAPAIVICVHAITTSTSEVAAFALETTTFLL